MKRNKFLLVSSILVSVLFKNLLSSIIPYTVNTSSLIMSASEWTLSRAQNGNLISALKDNCTSRLSTFSMAVFQRGDQANFQFNPKIYHQSYLNKGDIVASMYSNQDQEQLMRLEGELNVQKAELKFYDSGRKLADVEGIANQVAISKQELTTQRTLIARTEALYKDSLISMQEYEMALNKLRIHELNVKAAETNYRSATTGGKPEQIQVIRTRINFLQQQIQRIKNNLKDLTLTSPVSGVIISKKVPVNPAEEVLLSVVDNSAYALILPVDYLEREYIQPGQKIEIAITGTTRTAIGKIINIDNTVQLIDRHQAFFVTALIDEKNLPLLPGMYVKTTIICQPITLQEYLLRSIKLLFIY